MDGLIMENLTNMFTEFLHVVLVCYILCVYWVFFNVFLGMLKHKRRVFLPLRRLQSLILDKTGDPIYGMIVPAALSLQRADFFEVTRRMQRNRKKYRDTFRELGWIGVWRPSKKKVTRKWSVGDSQKIPRGDPFLSWHPENHYYVISIDVFEIDDPRSEESERTSFPSSPNGGWVCVLMYTLKPQEVSTCSGIKPSVWYASAVASERCPIFRGSDPNRCFSPSELQLSEARLPKFDDIESYCGWKKSCPSWRVVNIPLPFHYL
jgi:hypothetical protein